MLCEEIGHAAQCVQEVRHLDSSPFTARGTGGAGGRGGPQAIRQEATPPPHPSAGPPPRPGEDLRRRPHASASNAPNRFICSRGTATKACAAAPPSPAN